MADDFMERLIEDITSAIENPGEVSATTGGYIISKPPEMSDEDWATWLEKTRAAWADPDFRVRAAAEFMAATEERL